MSEHGCPHLRRQLGRVVFANGTTHRMERCLDCGHNARGAGVWVPRGEHAAADDELPLFADYTKHARDPGWSQPSLFDGM
jgi:hypothetical protein